MKASCMFPDDENGQVLRRMVADGDHLDIAREIEFVFVFPSRECAEQFESRIDFSQPHTIAIERSDTVPELPWDVVVSIHMLPTHQAISFAENTFGEIAQQCEGKADGWGCFQVA